VLQNNPPLQLMLLLQVPPQLFGVPVGVGVKVGVGVGVTVGVAVGVGVGVAVGVGVGVAPRVKDKTQFGLGL
jgi:hypothetical protein